jgi:hypothetical protein
MSEPPEDEHGRSSASRAGFEQIPLDLSRVPSVEKGLADAAERMRSFVTIAKEGVGTEPDQMLFREHLPFVSFINRASSLHAGIVSAVRDENPHAAFTLLRAYLELVVLVLYIDANPEYLDALERPMSEQPRGARKRFSEIFEVAAKEMAGVRQVYATLSEMAHFGSTAMWMPFTIDEEEERMLSFSTAPHWKKPDDARIALAMLRESDEAIVEVLRRYLANHITPNVEQLQGRRRIRRALEAMGGEVLDEEREVGTLPAEVAAEAQAAGLVAWCDEHGALEVADGVTPERFEEWVQARMDDEEQD